MSREQEELYPGTPHAKITGFKVYQVDLPLHEGNYSWSEGKSVDVFELHARREQENG